MGWGGNLLGGPCRSIVQDGFVQFPPLAYKASEPLDTYSSQFQHQEHSGKAMLDAVYTDGPLARAQSELARRATSHPECLLPLRTLAYHFEPHPDVDEVAVFRSAFDSIMDMSAQFWARIEAQVSNYPWKLLGLLDPRNSIEFKALNGAPAASRAAPSAMSLNGDAPVYYSKIWFWRCIPSPNCADPGQQAQLRREFADCPLCELDPGFSGPLREGLQYPVAVDIEARQLLTALSLNV
jgi:hypothetical protein